MDTNPYRASSLHQKDAHSLPASPNGWLSIALICINIQLILSSIVTEVTSFHPEILALVSPTLLLRSRVILGFTQQVLLIAWLFRAHKNLDLFARGILEHAHSKAVWGFFVPLVNLVVPYLVTKEIWVKSVREPTASSGLVGLWWSLTLVSKLSPFWVRVIGNLMHEPVPQFLTLSVTLLASVADIILIYTVANSQALAIHRIQFAGEGSHNRG